VDWRTVNGHKDHEPITFACHRSQVQTACPIHGLPNSITDRGSAVVRYIELRGGSLDVRLISGISAACQHGAVEKPCHLQIRLIKGPVNVWSARNWDCSAVVRHVITAFQQR
jgi:hypothetical protein